MKYIGNYPEQEIVHTWADRYDYVYASDPTRTINPSSLYATWLNSSTGEVFVCIDNTIGTNVWRGAYGRTLFSFDSDLIHWYPLTTNVYDVIGDVNATVYGGVSFTGSFAVFDGVDGTRIKISDNTFGLTTDWLISIRATVNPSVGDSVPLFHITDGSGSNVFAIWVRDAEDFNEIYLNGVSSGAGINGIKHDKEYHVALSSTGKLYIDGVEYTVPVVTPPGDLSLGTEINIGTDVDAGPIYNNALLGTIRDFRVYSRALSAVDVQAIYLDQVGL